MVAAVGVFALMDAALKHLAGAYSPAQVTFLRGAASLPFLFAPIVWSNAWGQLRATNPALHLMRAVLGITMLMSFIYSVSVQSLSGTYAIFMSAPLLIAAASRLLLGERVPRRRWLAIGVGLVGVLVALRPGASGFVLLGGLAAALSAVCYALNVLSIRVLGRTDSAHALVVWYVVLLSLGSGALAFPHWRSIAQQHWPWIAFVGLAGAIGQHLVTAAFRMASPATVAPFEYTALLWGVALDWLVFAKAPEAAVLLGAAIVIGSGLYVIWDDHRMAPERLAAGAAAG
jgi:drug/metabolite transporter (DMT)-like permease